MDTQRIINWERKLLDLTMANALVNTSFGSQCLLFREKASPAFLQELLVKKLSFPILWTDHEDSGLHVELEKDRLNKTAKKMMRASQNNLCEMGSSQLFLGFGMLHYIDNPDPLHPNLTPESHVAPVMLIPVILHQQTVVGKFAVFSICDDILINSTLIELLYQEHDRDLRHLIPSLGENPDVSKVFSAFSQMAKSKDGWEFCNDMCLGIFAFSKFVMWNDIHSHPTRMQQSPLIRSLLEQRPVVNDSGDPVDAKAMDKGVEPSALALPVAADSSQLEAVCDAELGRSFLLHGPPGTGKSQTITNIIANMLSKGKQTLFVAQKRAALEVVQERLREIGLAPFCLELHSNKVTKQYMIGQLNEVMEMGKTDKKSDAFREESEQLMATREQLIKYIELVHTPVHCKNGVYSLADCIEESLRNQSDKGLDVDKDVLLNLTDEEIAQASKLLHELEVIREDYDSIADHPLHALLPREGRGEHLVKMKETLEHLSEVLKKIIDYDRSCVRRLLFQKTQIAACRKLEEELGLLSIHPLSSEMPYAEKLNLVSQWLGAWQQMPRWAAWGSRCCALDALGLKNLGRYVEAESADSLTSRLRAQVARERGEELIASNETLAMFNGRLFDELTAHYREQTEAFRQLTVEQIQKRLRANVWKVMHDEDPAVQYSRTCIKRWCKSKGRGISIRSIMKEHGDVVRRLFPCMLMSPISVAQYLDIDASGLFDLVVFDEASQIPTAEAVGAIARGRSAVIVGDPQQMPPTRFFQAQPEDDDVEVADMESILDDFITLGMEENYLNYHYRSHHESLIAFSNHCYYGGRLITFPSVNDREQRIHYHYVDGIYDYSNTRTNRAEAEAIVAEVVRRLYDDELSCKSMGIIAFSKVQQDLIEDLLQSKIAHQPQLLKRAQRDGLEPLFVKNLENVQGDERDVVFFSVCYGPQENGNISMNFGPLNQSGGHRRLNVAVTRARQEMHVFTAMHYTDIDLDRSQAEGIANLRSFLQYAEHGALPLEVNGGESAMPAPHPIASELADALRSKGFQVEENVGRGRFRINLAVLDPDCPDRYLLGVLIDDKAYADTPTMRDREVTQPMILNGLGWRILKVWQEDYFQHPDRVLRQVIEACQSSADVDDAEEVSNSQDCRESVRTASNDEYVPADAHELSDEKETRSWRLAEGCAFGVEVMNDVDIDLSQRDMKVLEDYIVEHKTRVLRLNELREMLPDVFDSIRENGADYDPEEPWLDIHPDILFGRYLILQDEPLERAFDRLPKDSFANDSNLSVFIRSNEQAAEAVTRKMTCPEVSFSLGDSNGDQSPFQSGLHKMILTEESFSQLRDWIIQHHCRHIPLDEFRTLCPATYATIDGVSNLASEQPVFVALNGDVFEAAFDSIYHDYICY